ncbi:protein XAP5 CIRCADIAN TIMEKEEPER [Hordeum vulgare]|nr:protein XAP5 CIRCADIAN TIMEKEEPER [Hordeum vulgare]
MDAPKPTPAPAPATTAGPELYADIGKKARGGRISGFGDGYVGTAQDAVKIRRLEKQREAERRKIEELKSKNADGQPGLLQFGSSTS